MVLRSVQRSWFLTQKQEILFWAFDQRNFYHKREWQIDFSHSFVLKTLWPDQTKQQKSWKKNRENSGFILLEFHTFAQAQSWFIIIFNEKKMRKIRMIFDSSPLIQNSKFNNFLWVCWFLGKNLFFIPRLKTPQPVLPYLVVLDTS